MSIETQLRRPGLWEALTPVVALVVFIVAQIQVFEGDPHIPLILASAVAAWMAARVGARWSDIEEGILEGIRIGLKAILILMVVGMMISLWIAGGVAPTLIDYGLMVLSPRFFLLATCLICSVVSLATGSSWTTASTVGVALMGVGVGLEANPAMVAGAVVSGAYFGDKMSPLSDSTNLAPAVAGAELFEHIRAMLVTTGPAWVLALVLYGIIGWTQGATGANVETVEAIREALGASFQLDAWALTAPALVIVLILFRLPALPVLLAAAFWGGVLAMWRQGASLDSILEVAHYGYVSETGFERVDDLLSAGGLDSMMWTVSLVLCALSFGGIMERAGMLQRLADAALNRVRGVGGLVATTTGTAMGLNVIAPDQYLSIIGAGRMYRSAYRDRGLSPKLLSRTLEDGGTLTSPLVPWNTCGAFMFNALGVSPLAYLPFAFLNLAAPLIGILLAFAGIAVARDRPSGA